MIQQHLLVVGNCQVLKTKHPTAWVVVALSNALNELNCCNIPIELIEVNERKRTERCFLLHLTQAEGNVRFIKLSMPFGRDCGGSGCGVPSFGRSDPIDYCTATLKSTVLEFRPPVRT